MQGTNASFSTYLTGDVKDESDEEFEEPVRGKKVVIKPKGVIDPARIELIRESSGYGEMMEEFDERRMLARKKARKVVFDAAQQAADCVAAVDAAAPVSQANTIAVTIAAATAAVNANTAAAIADNNNPSLPMHYGISHGVAELSSVAIGNSFPMFTVIGLPNDHGPPTLCYSMRRAAPANTVLRLLYGYVTNDAADRAGMPCVLPDESATEHIVLIEHARPCTAARSTIAKLAFSHTRMAAAASSFLRRKTYKPTKSCCCRRFRSR